MTNCQDYDFDSTPPWRPKDKYRGESCDAIQKTQEQLGNTRKREQERAAAETFLNAFSDDVVVERVGGSDEFPLCSYGFKWNLSEMMKDAQTPQKTLEELIDEQAKHALASIQKRMFMEAEEAFMDVSDDHNITAPKPHSLDAVLASHDWLCEEARELVAKKGADYNRTQQANGDTLANLKAAYHLGLVESPAQGVIIRLLDKIMRLASLCKPGEKPANAEESIEDTVKDIINYSIYIPLLVKHHEA